MKIVLDGEPVAQIRMRYSGRNGIGRIYDPREKEKKRIKALIASKHCPIHCHPRVSFIFHMPIPKSIPKRLTSTYKSGLLKHEKKPDTDNFIKLYLDCMDGICFDGDQKVMLGPSIKLYHPQPKTIIIINETNEIISPVEVDADTWSFLSEKECDKQSSSEKDCPLDCDDPRQLDFWQSSNELNPDQPIESSSLEPPVPHTPALKCRVS